MPVELALNHPEPHDRVIYPTQRLIEPLLADLSLQLSNVNKFQRTKLSVIMDRVLLVGRHSLPPSAGTSRVWSHPRLGRSHPRREPIIDVHVQGRTLAPWYHLP